MSTNLYYQPHRPAKGKCLGQLKYIIADKYWGHDGSLSGEPITLTTSDLAYLHGIVDASHGEVKKDAQILANAIVNYGEVDIYIE